MVVPLGLDRMAGATQGWGHTWMRALRLGRTHCDSGPKRQPFLRPGFRPSGPAVPPAWGIAPGMRPRTRRVPTGRPFKNELPRRGRSSSAVGPQRGTSTRLHGALQLRICRSGIGPRRSGWWRGLGIATRTAVPLGLRRGAGRYLARCARLDEWSSRWDCNAGLGLGREVIPIGRNRGNSRGSSRDQCRPDSCKGG